MTAPRRLRLLLPVLVLLALGACGGRERLNLVLVTFDTTRADRLHPYGFDGVATPTLDALASEGVLFERARSSVPITLPSHTTILTGRYPPMHGVRDNGLFVVPAEATTLAETLAAAGYRTAAAVGAYPLLAKFGLAQGFELYDDRLDRAYEDFRGQRVRGKVSNVFFDERPAERVNEAVYPWLEEHHDEPFFLWVHYFDPHQPFVAPRPYSELYTDDAYAGELAYADESLGTLLATLRRLGAYDRTIVVFTADHGEGLGEHGEITHSTLLYDTTLHVPLIVRAPGVAGGRRIATPVSHVDVLPTLLDLLELPPPSGLDGHSLAAVLHGGAAPEAPPYAETLSPRLGHGWGELRSWIDGDWKLVYGPRVELFDTARDARELDNRLAVEPERARRMEESLRRFLAERAPSGPRVARSPDAETRRRLEALGYVQSAAAEAVEIREELSREGVAPQDRVHRVTLETRAKDLLTRGEALPARNILDTLLAEEPESSYYLELQARAAAMLGDFDEALAILDRAREGGGEQTASLLVQMAGELARAGRKAEALDRVRQAVAIEPSGEAFFLESLLATDLGEVEAAGAALERAVAADPGHGPALVALAIRRAGEGKAAEAEAAFATALRENPYYPRAHFNYGAFLFERRRIEEAAERFERAVALDPDYRAAYEAAAGAYVALGRADEAARIRAAQAAVLPQATERDERGRQPQPGGAP